MKREQIAFRKRNKKEIHGHCLEGIDVCNQDIFRAAMKLEATGSLLMSSFKSDADSTKLGLGHFLLSIKDELGDIHSRLQGVGYSLTGLTHSKKAADMKARPKKL